MEGAGNIYTADRAIDSSQVPKNCRGYHDTDQLAPSIDACVLMSSAVAKAHAKGIVLYFNTDQESLKPGYCSSIWDMSAVSGNETSLRNGLDRNLSH
jgi:hypothetical protein